ncbi:6-phospho-3-hexuloisomerase [Streptococcus suis]|uniref:6-phospho-3-hexuloisomerase n=1 Tax=Streptococcus suis TaxID=1307 RepID=UPI003EFD36FD
MQSKIIREIEAVLNSVDSESVEKLTRAIVDSPHIFVGGMGRSGLMIRAFANILMHLGKAVSVVGEVTSPHSKAGDFLLIGSGSGETGSLIALAKKAKNSGVTVGLLTTNSKSSIASLADIVVVVPAASKEKSQYSLQPMGSTFEQASLILYDSLVLHMMKHFEETPETMSQRHADFE